MKKRAGYALIFVIMVLPILGILITILSNNAIQQRQLAATEQGQGRVFYMAEYGLNYAFKAFTDNVFGVFTHTRESSRESINQDQATSHLLLSTELTQERPFTKTKDGWYEWNWYTNDAVEESLTGSGLPERIRFKIVILTSSDLQVGWEIVSEAHLGGLVRSHRLSGQLEDLNDYTVFVNGDREYYNSAMKISGKQHYNGNVYHGGNTTFIDTYHLSAQKIAIGRRPRDTHFENPSESTMQNRNGAKIKTKLPSGSTVKWTNGLDSFSDSKQTDWLEFVERMHNEEQSVRDANTGAPTIEPPSFRSLKPDGFYGQQAKRTGLYIDPATVQSLASLPDESDKKWVREVKFYHAGEKRNTSYWLLDFQKMKESGQVQALIYSEHPTIVYKAADLPMDLNFVCQGNIIVSGDFNDESRRSAGIISGGHNWFATEGLIRRIETDPFKTYTLNNVKTRGPEPVEDPAFDPKTGKPQKNGRPELAFFGAAVEAIPFESGYFAKGDASSNYAHTPPIPGPIGQGRREHLEDLSGITFNKRGSDVALMNGSMLPLDHPDWKNAKVEEGIPWVRSHPMRPPKLRVFTYDAKLIKNIPFSPKGAKKQLWRGY